MRAFWAYALAAVLSPFIVACGGGGGGGAPIALVDVADCFQVKTGNALRYTSTASPSKAQTQQAANATSSTTFNYSSTVADISYKTDILNGAPVMARVSSGTETYTTTAAIEPRSFEKSEFFTSTPNFAFVGAKARYPSIDYISETAFSGLVRPLSVQVGQPHNFSYVSTETSIISGNAPITVVSTTSQAVTFLTREDVLTPAGTFKNSCKFTSDTKLIQTSTGNTSSTASISAGINSTQWYAPGWGLVKQDSSERFTDGRLPASLAKSSSATAILTGSL